MQTLNQHISLFQTFASNHKQIHSSGVGDLWELTESEEERVYPLMWIQIDGSTVSGNEIVDSYTIVFCDLVHPDESDENEVLSDQKLIGLDFLSYLKQSTDLVATMDIVKNSSVQFFTEKWEDTLSGVIITVQVKQPMTYDLCSVPMSGLPPTYIGCAGVDIYVNGVFSETVESGGTYSYNTGGGDVDVTVNGSTYDTVTSPDSLDIPVVNSVGTAVGTVDAGVKVLIADTTINIYLDGVLQGSTDVVAETNETINVLWQ